MSALQELQRRRLEREQTPEVCAFGALCDRPESLDYLFCRGQGHHGTFKVHRQCAKENEDVDRESWECGFCRAASEVDPSSQGSVGSGPEWNVAGIFGSRYDDNGNEWLYICWQPQAGQRYNHSWEQIENINAEALIQRFRDEGKAVWQAGYQPSDYGEERSLFAQAIANASDLRQVREVAYSPFEWHISHGFVALLAEIWPEARTHSAVSKINMSWNIFKSIGLEILASTPAEAFLAICSGSFAARKEDNDDLSAVVDEYSKGRRPCIYIVELADPSGEGLRMWQLARIVEHARAFLDRSINDRTVRIHRMLRGIIDYDIIPQVKGSARPFLESGQTEQKLLTLCGHIERELDKLKAQGYTKNVKMPYVLRHIGYAVDGSIRLKHHENHQNSNKLLGLFALIAQADEELAGCSLHGHVFYQCWRIAHAYLAEIIYSIIAQSYVETGRGFNAKKAGGSNESAMKEPASKWILWQTNVLVRSNFKANLEAEMERIADNKAQLKRAKQELRQYKLRQILEKRRMAELYQSTKNALAELETLKLELAQETEQAGAEEELENGGSASTEIASRPSAASSTQASGATAGAAALPPAGLGSIDAPQQPTILIPTNAPQVPIYPNWHSLSPAEVGNFMRDIRNDRAALEGAIRSMFAANQAHYSAALNNHIANAVYRGHTQRFWARQGPGFPYVAFLSPEDDKERSPWY